MSFDLKAIISADPKPFYDSLGKVRASLGALGQTNKLTTRGAANAWKSFGGSLSGVGKALSIGVSAPVIAAGAASVKAGADFESAFAGVNKTVDMTADEADKMKKSIKAMSKEIPSSTTEIAAVAEAAGQLGIQKKNILGFTRTMIDLGQSTNMSSDEAASALARLANITQMPQDKFDNLGSTIVALGNNFATTESEITDMGLRLAGTGHQIGMSESEILGLSAAMSSVGIQAEAGGTAMSMVMNKINNAVADGGNKMRGFARIAEKGGLAGKDFAKVWKNDPTKALVAFVAGLKKTKEEGGNVNMTLKQLKISGVREVDTLTRLSGSAELLPNAFSMANKAFSDNSALSEEAGKRYQTLQSKIEVCKNKFHDIATTIGEILMPYVQQAVDKIGQLTEKFSALSPEQQEHIVKWIGIAAAMGPVLIMGGHLISGILKMIELFKTISGGIAGTSGHLSGLAAAFPKLLPGVGIVAAVALAIKHAYDNSEQFRAAVQNMSEKAGAAFQWLKETAEQAFDKIKQALAPVGEALSGLADLIGAILVPVFALLGLILEKVGGWLGNLWDKLKEVGQAIKEFFQPLGDALGGFFGWMGEKMHGAADSIRGFTDDLGITKESVSSSTAEMEAASSEHLSTMTANAQTQTAAYNAAITTNTQTASNNGKTAVSSLTASSNESLLQLVARAQSLTSQAGDSVSSNLRQASRNGSGSIENLKTNASTYLSKLAEVSQTDVQKASKAISDQLQSANINGSGSLAKLQSQAGEDTSGIAEVTSKSMIATQKAVTVNMEQATAAMEKNTQTMSQMTQTMMHEMAAQSANGMKNFYSQVRSGMANSVSEVKTGSQKAVNAAKSYQGSFVDTGANMSSGLASGIRKGVSWITNAARSVASRAVRAARNALGIHSPSRVFDREVGRRIPEGMGRGIERSAGAVTGAIGNLVNQAMDAADLSGAFSRLESPIFSGGQVNISETLKENDKPVKPLILNVELDGRAYRAFVDDISNAQDKQAKLELGYMGG